MLNLPIDPPRTLTHCKLRAYRLTTRGDFCKAFGIAPATLRVLMHSQRYALPDEWRELTYLNFVRHSFRANLCPYQVWVLHAALNARQQVTSWKDCAELIRAGRAQISFARFQDDYQRWGRDLEQHYDVQWAGIPELNFDIA